MTTDNPFTLSPDNPDGIRAHIEHYTEAFAHLAHPALLARLVLRKGRVGKPQRRPRGMRKRAYKQCFKNASEFVIADRDARYEYVEGLAINPSLGVLIHHAWAEDGQQNVIDLTWKEPQKCLYMGVPFTQLELSALLCAQRTYGLFDKGMGLNTDLIFGLDPELREIAEAIMSRSRQNPFINQGA